jgi:CRP-like cAMP-binding protein
VSGTRLFLSLDSTSAGARPSSRGGSPTAGKKKAESKDRRNLEDSMAQKLSELNKGNYHTQRAALKTRTQQWYSEKDFKEGLLRDCAYTRMLSEELRTILATECQIAKFQTGDVVVRQDDSDLCMYILSVGELGEYRGFPDPSKVRAVDPNLQAAKRVRTLSSEQDVICVLSLFLGRPADGTYAAMKTSTMLRVPANAIQPILSNQPHIVDQVASVLVESGLFGANVVAEKKTLMTVANKVSAFHSDLSRMYPGDSWKLSPRSRARQPRTFDKQFDIPQIDNRAHDETVPCVGHKEGVLIPSRPKLGLGKASTVAIPENSHLSPRFLERDRFSGACAMRLSVSMAGGGVVSAMEHKAADALPNPILSRLLTAACLHQTRPFDEVARVSKSRSGIPRQAEGQEDWALQSTVVESPIVKLSGTAPGPVHAILGESSITIPNSCVAPLITKSYIPPHKHLFLFS